MLSIPIFVLTGFLGSGKTTLLRSLLADDEMRDTAVIVNELGEVGLDHFLVREVDDEVVLLGSGCVCCTVRDDLVSTLAELHEMREAGTIPPFSRVVVETTGLADPAPILLTLLQGRNVKGRYELSGLVTTVDGQFGSRELDEHEEARKQAALADRLVITKVDLADPAQIEALRDRLRALNPSARVIESTPATLPGAALLFDLGRVGHDANAAAVHAWLDVQAYAEKERSYRPHRHDERIGSFCIRIAQPLAWERVIEWLELLLASRGDSILRLKGLVNVAGAAGPVVIQGVQHMLYPPEELAAWPDEDHTTRLVFITRDLTRTAVETSLRQVLGDAIV